MNRIELFGLGRIYSPDERDGNFPMSALPLPEVEGKDYRYWYPHRWWGNQGNKPQCVAFSWVHWLTEGPLVQKYRNPPPYDPGTLYDEAQKVDEWEGEGYAGTSVRAGAKILQQKGFISGYYWSWNIDEITRVLLSVGPVVVGTTWTNDMFKPDVNGFIKPTGNPVGGHAYLLDGVNMNEKFIRIKNSWGRQWGREGFAYIKFEDMGKLITSQGEACIAMEVELE